VPAIDDLVPEYDAREVHSVALAVDPARAVEAALAVTVASDAIVATLLRLRGLRGTGTIGDSFARMGFEELERNDHEVVFDASGMPWRPRGGIRRFDDAALGSVRVATDFRSDGARLTTETRVAAIDDAARRAFLRYWRVVGPFSALIRRRWLAAASAAAQR